LIAEFELKASAGRNLPPLVPAKNDGSGEGDSNIRSQIARILLTAILLVNLSAAIPYLIRPDDYAAAYELTGVPGEVMVRGLGILFLMWAVPFIPAILHPVRHRIAFVCVLAMQAIGLAGESLMVVTLPAGHDALRATGLRFIVFDGTGLILLLVAFGTLYAAYR
jgi:hypothetical protein